MPTNTCDVIVMGGGPAGVSAAIQAARHGAHTLLIEKQAQLGGTTTIGGINGIQTFFAYGTQVIAGIGWELICRSAAVLGQPPPDGSRFGENNGITVTSVDRAVYTAVVDQAVIEAGVDLSLHTMLGRIEQDEDDTWRLTLCGKHGLYDVRGRVVIDCTGDCNAITLAGLSVCRRSERQPATLVMALTGYDAESLDMPTIQQAFDEAVAAGTLKRSDVGWHGGDVRPLLKGYGGNCVHVIADEAADSGGRTATELEARRLMLRLIRFFRTQPGLENLTVSWFAPECGVRETVTINGRATITGDDYATGRLWPDAVCYSFYAIDVHTEGGLDYRPLPRGVIPRFRSAPSCPKMAIASSPPAAASAEIALPSRPIAFRRHAWPRVRRQAPPRHSRSNGRSSQRRFPSRTCGNCSGATARLSRHS